MGEPVQSRADDAQVTSDTRSSRFHLPVSSLGSRTSLTIVLLVAAGIRLAYAVARFHTPLTFDSKDYVRHAASIVAGHGYPPALGIGGPTALRPPGYPYFLAGVFAVTGSSIDGARIAQALIGTAIVALIGLIAYQLWDAAAAVAAAFIAAVYPGFIVVGSALLSEPLFVLFELSAIAAALRYRRTPALRWAALSGILVGLAWLTRSTGPALLIPLLLLVTRRGPSLARTALAPAVVLVAAVCVLLPWTIRNEVVTHSFIVVSDQDGYTLAGTYNATSQARGDAPWIPAQLDPTNLKLMTQGRPTEAVFTHRLLLQARHYAKTHPAYVADVALDNSKRLLQLDGGGNIWADVQGWDEGGPLAAHFVVYGFWVLLALALVGAAGRAWKGTPAVIWLTPLLLSTVIFVESGTRFRYPIEPFLTLIAGAFIAQRLRRRPTPAAPA